MKMIYRSILIFLVLTIAVFAQQKTIIQQTQEKISNEESYPVDARPYLERFKKEHSAEIERLKSIQTLKKINWNFQIGDKHTWQSADLRTGATPYFYSVSSTCRAVGSHCYVFVQDSAWVDINNKVNQAVVDSVQLAFDARTPANPYKGIYDTDVETFGNPSTTYDPKIIILLLDIRDGYKGPPGGYVAGYFYSTAEGYNGAHIYFLDTNPLPFLNPDGKTINSSGLTTGMKTTAHEFQHMIHWNYIPNAETFFNEGWSLAAEVINGYTIYDQSYFLSETNQYLLYWRQISEPKIRNDYSRAARFSLYLKEQFGTTILKNYLTTKVNGVPGGVAGLNSCILALNSNRDFASVLVDWWLANFLNENVSNTHSEWVYTYTPLTKVNSNVTYTNPNVTNGTTSGLYKYSAEYITFNSGKNLKINFNTTVNGRIQIKAIKTNAATKVIENVTPGIDYSVPDYSSVTFMVYHNDGNDSQAAPFIYSFNSSGITEVNESIESLPSSFSLGQNYPNPFNPETVISYRISVISTVVLKIYDMLGREVTTLVDKEQMPGTYNSKFSISKSQLPSGVYFYTLTAGDKIETKKMILMK